MTATIATQVGDKLPVHNRVAINLSNRSDRDFEKNIHDDKTASKLGFKRGFVAGGQTMSWISKMLVEFFGESMFKTGKVECKYISPVFEDDEVTISGEVRERVEEDGGVRLICDIWMDKPDGSRAIAGTVSALVR